MKPLYPEGWPRPKGYSNAMAARGRMVFTAGVVGWNDEAKFRRNHPRRPVRANTPQHPRDPRLRRRGPGEYRAADLLRDSIDEYRASRKDIGEAWKAIMGAHYPAMALVEVVRLVEPEAKVEIEATAVVPNKPVIARSAATWRSSLDYFASLAMTA